MWVGWDSSFDGAGKHSNGEEKISSPDRTQMFGLHTCDLPYVRKPLNDDEEKSSRHDQTEMFGLHTDDDLAYSPPNNASAANTVPQELMVVGTTEGCLRVWMRFNGSHGWIPAWTRISTDGSIVCLSFRADGQLLAAGASQLLNSNELDTTIQNRNPNKLFEHVHLYETSNWSCVASLGFKSRIGSCIFYHPSTSAQDQDHLTNKACDKNVEKMSRDILASSDFLLVCTSQGVEAFLLPKLELPSSDEPFKRNGIKTVSWAQDTKHPEGRNNDVCRCNELLTALLLRSPVGLMKQIIKIITYNANYPPNLHSHDQFNPKI
jgi:hypothetical protein